VERVAAERWFQCPKCRDMAERYPPELRADYRASAECTNPECDWREP
jgi:hypothetical protein